MVVHALELLKRSSLCPWLAEHTDQANRWVSIIAAVLSAAGFVFVMSGDVQTGGTITITFPPLIRILNMFLHACAQTGAQEVYYRIVVKDAKSNT